MSSSNRKSNSKDSYNGNAIPRQKDSDGSNYNRGYRGSPWFPDEFKPNVSISVPSLAMLSNGSNKPLSTKQALAAAAVASIGSTVWNTWQDSRYESMRRHAERAEDYATEQRKARFEAERREAHERRLRELGIEPDREVSPKEIADARMEIGYVQGSRNIVIAGNLSAGKSSLINAVRDANFGDEGYAPTGSVETTTGVRCYADDRHEGIFWYDTPGAGTANVSAWGYYYTQKLFAYDIVILAHESSLTQADNRILQVCELFKQPCYIVRTKRDQHIQNWAQDMGCTLDEAREAFLREVQSDVNRLTPGAPSAASTDSALVLDYVISAKGIRSALKREPSPNDDPVRAYVDEERFLEALGLLKN